MALSEKDRQLLIEVAWTIVEDDITRRRERAARKRMTTKRQEQITEIARDDRITSRAMHTQAALIRDVAARYHVTPGNAKTMIYRARRLKGISPIRPRKKHS